MGDNNAALLYAERWRLQKHEKRAEATEYVVRYMSGQTCDNGAEADGQKGTELPTNRRKLLVTSCGTLHTYVV